MELENVKSFYIANCESDFAFVSGQAASYS